MPAPSVGVAGATLYLRFTVTGFTRDPKTKQPNTQIEITFLTKDGKPTLAEPSTDTIDDADGNLIHSSFTIPLNRSGDFTIELKATDKVSKATSKVEMPLKVLAPGN
jgi:hypothetical protein